MKSYLLLSVLIACALCACDEEDTPSTPTEAEEVAPAPEVTETPEVVAVAPVVPAEPSGQGEETTPPLDPADPAAESELENANEGSPSADGPPEGEDPAAAPGPTPQPGDTPHNSLAEAIGAAAQPRSGAPCEQAWSGLEAMFQTLERRLGPGSQGGAPDRAEFMSVCERMSEPVQHCMVMSYALENQEACREVMQGPEGQELRQMMTGQ
jgi:hypothetical protein